MILFLSLVVTAALGVAVFLYVHKRSSKTKSPLSSTGAVHTTLCPTGSVLVDGELWLAQSLCGSVILQKTKVIVVGLRDHLLLVTPLSDEL